MGRGGQAVALVLTAVGGAGSSSSDKTPLPEHEPVNVLGFDIGGLPENEQLMLCSFGVVGFHVVQGFLQELLVIEVFNRRYSSFITLLNFIGLAAMAFTARRLRGQTQREVPLLYHLFMSACTTTSVGLTYLSMRWLDYPTKTLFKSSRMLLTMAAGAILFRRAYTPLQWLSAAMILCGLALFTCGDAIVSSNFDAFGVMLIVGALAGEVAKAMTQERVLRRFPDARPTELIFYDNLLSGLWTAAITVSTGEASGGLRWMLDESHGYPPVLTLTATAAMVYVGYNGCSIVTSVVGHFGAVSAAMITTVRKAASILLSFILFPKPVSPLHVVGGLLFLAGLVFNKMKPAAPKEPVGIYRKSSEENVLA